MPVWVGRGEDCGGVAEPELVKRLVCRIPGPGPMLVRIIMRFALGMVIGMGMGGEDPRLAPGERLRSRCALS
jgi:hypothetical protein